ncbi:hypothetical protein [Rhizobium johnstonii]
MDFPVSTEPVITVLPREIILRFLIGTGRHFGV